MCFLLFSCCRRQFLKTNLSLLIFALSVFSFGCGIKVRDSVPVVLSPLSTIEKDKLIAEVNRFADVKTIRGKVDVKFEDNSFAESGISEKYRTADGQVIVEAPSKINLKIQIPVVGSDLVQMTSDGEKFRVAVICCVEEKYKKFVYGTNANDYGKLREKARDAKGNNDQNRAISVFGSLRPQHFTDALIMRPVQTGEDYIYTQSEIYADEPGTTKKKSPIARVIRGYYLLDELRKTETGDYQITRRFWFDRVNAIRLAKQQVFDHKGVLETDIAYGVEQKFTDTGAHSLPIQVQITRPQERYSVKLSYQIPNEVIIGRPYEAAVFLLENKWQLPEVDLDKQAAQAKLLDQ